MSWMLPRSFGVRATTEVTKKGDANALSGKRGRRDETVAPQ